MRFQTYLFGVAALAMGFAPDSHPLSSQTGGSPQTARTALIAGRVVDATGAAVSNAVVWLRAEQATPNPQRSQQGERVLSNADGRFAFGGLAPGSYRVEVTRPGWLTGAYGRRRPGGNSARLDLKEAERRNDLAITLWRTAVIGGRVSDEAGDPLIGAEVRAIRQIYVAGRPHSDTAVRAQTDDRGVYRFSTLLPGDYLIVVLMSVLSEPATFAGAIRASGETPQSYLQTMTATATAPILFERATGVVSQGQPLVRSLSQSLTAAAAGRPWLAYATTYHPSSASSRSAALVRATTGEAREDVDIRVPLQPTWQVSGVLRDADGPLAWHAVHLVPAESDDTPIIDVGTAVTDVNGVFTFYGVPSGQFVARVVRTPWPGGGGLAIVGGTAAVPWVATLAGPGAPSNEPLMHASQAVTVTDRHVRDVMLLMQPGPRVKGLVRFEGDQAAPDLTRTYVLLEPASGRLDRAIVPATFGSEGGFTSQSVLPGRYLIRSNAPAGWAFKGATYQGRDVSETPIDLAADIDNVIITFTSQPRTIKGAVASETLEARIGALVILFPVDPTDWVDYGRTSRRVTAGSALGDGSFSLPLPPDGDYWIVAIPDEDSEDWQNPATLKQFAKVAERIRVRGESVTSQSLQLRRIR